MEADYLKSRGWLRTAVLEPGKEQPRCDPRRLRLVNQNASYPITVLCLGSDAGRIHVPAKEAVVVPLHRDANHFIIYSDTARMAPYALTWCVVPGLARQAEFSTD
jgi:hypothetical protein